MPKGIYLIPNGPKNLASLFPTINWRNLSDYYIEALDEQGYVIATTCINKLCNCTDGLRIHFLQYCGAYDAANFIKPTVLHETLSSIFQNALNHPQAKTDTQVERFNVKAFDTYQVTRKSLEEEMAWLQECADTISAFIEWKGIEGQPDAYIPVVIQDGKFEKLKNDKEYQYDFTLQFKLSQEIILIRN